MTHTYKIKWLFALSFIFNLLSVAVILTSAGKTITGMTFVYFIGGTLFTFVQWLAIYGVIVLAFRGVRKLTGHPH